MNKSNEKTFYYVFNSNNVFTKTITSLNPTDLVDIKPEYLNSIDIEINDKKNEIPDIRSNNDDFERILAKKYYRLINSILSSSVRKRKLWKEFKKNFLDVVAENTYEKLKCNMINYFVEKPFADIFDIAFSRYIKSSTFKKSYSKISNTIFSFECSTSVRFQLHEDAEYIDETYMSLQLFRAFVDMLSDDDNPISYTPRVTDNNTNAKIKLVSDKQNLVTNCLKMVIVRNIRDLFFKMFISEISSDKNTVYTKIITDITSFYIRNASSINESREKIKKHIDKYISRNDIIGLMKRNIIASKMSRDPSRKGFDDEIKIYYSNIIPFDINDEKLISSLGVEFIHFYELNNEIESIAKPSVDPNLDMSINMDFLNNKYLEILKTCSELRKDVSKIYAKYCMSGYKDDQLFSVLNLALELYINAGYQMVFDKIHCFDILTSIYYDNDWDVVAFNIDDITDFNSLLKHIYNDDQYVTIINSFKERYEDIYCILERDLNTLYSSFTEKYRHLMELCKSYIECIDLWMKQILETKIQRFALIDIKSMVLKSIKEDCSIFSNDFINYENKFFIRK